MINFLLPFHQHFDQSLSHALTTKRVASVFVFVPIGKTSTWSHMIKNYEDMLPHVRQSGKASPATSFEGRKRPPEE